MTQRIFLFKGIIHFRPFLEERRKINKDAIRWCCHHLTEGNRKRPLQQKLPWFHWGQQKCLNAEEENLILVAVLRWHRQASVSHWCDLWEPGKADSDFLSQKGVGVRYMSKWGQDAKLPLAAMNLRPRSIFQDEMPVDSWKQEPGLAQWLQG